MKNWNLAIVQKETNATAIFSPGSVDRLLSDLEAEVLSVIIDPDTAMGRKEIASLAHKVSRSKTALDALGKNLVSEWKSKSKAVDIERKQIRDRLDALREKIRKPLTDWEDSESARVQAEKLAKQIDACHIDALVENELFTREKEILRKEQEQRALEQKQAEEKQARKEQEQRALEQKQAEEKQAHRERLIRQEAEQQAKRETQQKIMNARLAEEKAKREKLEEQKRRIRELQEQKLRLKKEQNEKEAAKKRCEDEEKAKAKRKAANKEHQRNINEKIFFALVSIGVGHNEAKQIIISTAKGDIPNLKISY